jgi:hypothetical protein
MSNSIFKTPTEIAEQIVAATAYSDREVLTRTIASALTGYGAARHIWAINEADHVAQNILAEARDIDGEDASLCGELQDDIGAGIRALLTKEPG